MIQHSSMMTWHDAGHAKPVFNTMTGFVCIGSSAYRLFLKHFTRSTNIIAVGFRPVQQAG